MANSFLLAADTAEAREAVTAGPAIAGAVGFGTDEGVPAERSISRV